MPFQTLYAEGLL
uniref:Uncharacterized protein n=1 Tax=Anguilla anguilla TaxID=7936 RepID=A0A0E9USW7_ANGAN